MKVRSDKRRQLKPWQSLTSPSTQTCASKEKRVKPGARFGMSGYPKIVESHHYHLWTDALHARALAHQSRNDWDRGTYVRWAVTTAWTVLEIACQNALNEPNISYSFRKHLDKAIARGSLTPLNWGSGVWQKVLQLQQLRKNYVHRFLRETELFPEAAVADNAIDVVRRAVVEIYRHSNRVPPPWIQDNEDRGWNAGRGSMANATVIRAGAKEDDPKVVKIAYVTREKEHVSEVLPPGTDPEPYVEDLLRNIRIPIKAIRVYEGDTLRTERVIKMRGA
jgi:hypothetical protein